MLIARNVPTAFRPLSIIYGGTDELWVGWTIIRQVCLDDPNPKKSHCTASMNRITFQRENLLDYDPDKTLALHATNGVSDCACVAFFASKSQTKDVTSPQQIREMMELD